LKIQESGENYLETILLLRRRNGNVRSINIANELGYSKPSVSRAMGILKKAGYITMDASGFITLTDSGCRRAVEIYDRHCLITKYLMRTLGVDEQTAAADACRIEHVISGESFMRIRSLFEAIE